MTRRKKKPTFKRFFAGDTETWGDGITTEAWASGLLEIAHNANIGEELTPIIHDCLEKTYRYFMRLKENSIVAYHNLAFDGQYWYHLLRRLGYTQKVKKLVKLGKNRTLDYALAQQDANNYKFGAVDYSDLDKGEFTYCIDDMGRWFYMIIKLKNGYFLELRDSLKLFPMSLSQIAKQTKYKLEERYFKVAGRTLDYKAFAKGLLKKGSIDYRAKHLAGEEITEKEAIYLCKDLAILGRTLEDFIRDFNGGFIQNVPLTIGQLSMREFVKTAFGYGNDKAQALLEARATYDPLRLEDASLAYEIKRQLMPDLTKESIDYETKFIGYNNLEHIDLETVFKGKHIKKHLYTKNGSLNYPFLYDVEYRERVCTAEELQIANEIFPITQDAYIRPAYHGGWCYVNPIFKGMILEGAQAQEQEAKRKHIDGLKALEIICQYQRGGRIIKVGKMACSVGCTMDVNSLYPYVMTSESGNKYAYGVGKFYNGDIPQHVKDNPDDYCFFARFNCDFELKPKHFPSVQIKNSILCNSTEWLTTSKFKDLNGFKHDRFFFRGKEYGTAKTLTMYETDFELFKENYEIENLKMIDCLVFPAYKKSFFDDYIQRFSKMKQDGQREGNGFKRLMAKLLLNNLYGKMATSTDSNTKTLKMNPDGSLKYETWYGNDKKAGYVAIGAAITANARCYTIRAANDNFDYFVYADTDSIHCLCPPEMLKGIQIDWKDVGTFGLWKCENTWTAARFLGAKTYFEQFENDDPIIKACGAPDNCKETFILGSIQFESMANDELYNLERFKRLPIECQNQIKEKREQNDLFTIRDFDIGLKLEGKLLKKQISGGCFLTPTTFEIHDRTPKHITEKLKGLSEAMIDKKANKKDLRQQTQAHKPQNTTLRT